MAITLKSRMYIEDATTSANRWGGIGSQYDKKPFEKDISWGGYSGLPFIKPLVPKDVNQYFSLTTAALSLDFPIRGGSYEEIAARTDFARIDRFVLTYPQGKAFLDKQKGLALSNPKTEVALLANTEITRLFPERPVPLFQQLTAGGTGFHYGNLGESGNDLINQANTYGQTVARKPLIENRLFNLYQTKINVSDGTNFSDVQDIFGTISNIFSPTLVGEVPSQVSTRLGITKTQDSFLMSYQGGPGSRYGIGSTDIYRATDATGAIIATGRTYPDYKVINSRGPVSTDINGNEVQGTDRVILDFNNLLGASLTSTGKAIVDNEIINGQLPNLEQQNSDGFIRHDQGTTSENAEQFFSNTLTYDALLNQVNPNNPFQGQDFRNRVANPNTVQSRNYRDPKINKTTRVGIGSPGNRPSNLRTNTSDVYSEGQDRVNILDIQSGGSTFTEQKRDLIKFGFDVIGNDSGNPFASFNFRAFLTGYSDNHQSQWDAKRYTGRGENFYTYQGFDRSVNFNFKIAAQSKQEMKPLYNKLNGLLSTLYPDYNKQGFMRGNIVRLTVGDLFTRTPGILESLNLTVNDEYPWEIAFNSPEGGDNRDMLEVPQIIDVAVSFKPILTDLPKLSSNILIPKNGREKVPYSEEAQWLTNFNING